MANERSKTQPILSPAVRRLVAEFGLDASQITPTGRDGRITKGDVLQQIKATGKHKVVPEPLPGMPRAVPPPPPLESGPTAPLVARETREPMSTHRHRVVEDLLLAQQSSVILTSFGEADMSSVLAWAEGHPGLLQDQPGAPGVLAFYVKAVAAALSAVPAVNRHIEGNEIVQHNYADVGLVLDSPSDQVSPVIHDVAGLTLPEVARSISDLARRAQQRSLPLDRLDHSAFTIGDWAASNLLLSTPMLSPAQSGMLGLYRIQQRPVVVRGRLAVRPMMYLALSYDNRLIDGREAGAFLDHVVRGVEDAGALAPGV